jgi:hypothetical protein
MNCCYASPWRLGLPGRIFLTWLTCISKKRDHHGRNALHLHWWCEVDDLTTP